MDSDDALDAVVCILAARGFLEGHCIAPSGDEDLLKSEGWIWVKDPDQSEEGSQ